MPLRPDLKHEAYCGQCGYVLEGLTDSARCPECGRPIVEVLTRNAHLPQFGKRYRSKATLFGWPVIDIALGPKGAEPRGRARGIIAIGDIATGAIACGGLARGIVAVGGLSFGLFSIGGAAVGLITAFGGFAFGSLATGGFAVGLLASGGFSFGLYAQGGAAIGLHARGALRGSAPGDFTGVRWFFGDWPPTNLSSILPMVVIGGIDVFIATAITLVALVPLARDKHSNEVVAAGENPPT